MCRGDEGLLIPSLLSPLVCPLCRSDVDPRTLSCSGCGRRFEAIDGIPALLGDGNDQSRRQAAYFDDATDPEFETERPHGTPSLYAWLMRQKFLRATAGVPLEGRSVLVVCGGSGMDAEFLAAAGARVVSSDISLGAARRVQERSRRHGVPIEAVVADAERLPFPDCSFDIVYVHDGLHHIEQPLVGLAEMARVARTYVCVTEPARAGLTALAVRAGLALDREDAGNRVARLRAAEVEQVVLAAGFTPRTSRRYAMFYRHEPATLMRLLSMPAVFPLTRVALASLLALSSRFGNKLVVVAERTAAASADRSAAR